MSTRSVLLGSLELKRVYQRNMLIGFGISGGASILILGIIVLIMYIGSQKNYDDIPTVMYQETSSKILPPTIRKQQEQIRVATPQRQIRPSVGVPEPVPDEEAPEEIEIATQDELMDMAPITPIEDLEDLNVDAYVEGVLDELLPSPDQFVPFEEAAVKIKDVKPTYPELARRAGIQGVVWIKALVDKEGKVRDVVIVKDSGANAGFEEAAIEAAYATVWRPAIANGQPVALWVTYKVNFVLGN